MVYGIIVFVWYIMLHTYIQFAITKIHLPSRQTIKMSNVVDEKKKLKVIMTSIFGNIQVDNKHVACRNGYDMLRSY